MSDAFAGLEPAAFWRHFAALTTIPRPSHEEERVAAHVTAWAEARGFGVRADAAGNLVVDVPATPGREGAPAVILQGHLDMVCEREPDSPYDPREGRIHVVRDGEWLLAEGTTLGADDGVAIAAMLALAETGAPHGRLELLMTVAEEVGLAGAQALDPALVTGDVLLNLDSEEDGTLTIGCAGSEDHVLTFTAPREPLPPGAELLRGHGLRRPRRALRRRHRDGPRERDQAPRPRAARGGRGPHRRVRRRREPQRDPARRRGARRGRGRARRGRGGRRRRAAHATPAPTPACGSRPRRRARPAQPIRPAAPAARGRRRRARRLLDLIALLPAGPLAMSAGLPAAWSRPRPRSASPRRRTAR